MRLAMGRGEVRWAPFTTSFFFFGNDEMDNYHCCLKAGRGFPKFFRCLGVHLHSSPLSLDKPTFIIVIFFHVSDSAGGQRQGFERKNGAGCIIRFDSGCREESQGTEICSCYPPLRKSIGELPFTWSPGEFNHRCYTYQLGAPSTYVEWSFG